MHDTITSILIGLLALLALGAAAGSIAALVGRRPRPGAVVWLTGVIAAGLLGLNLYLVAAGAAGVAGMEAWQPLDSHFEGLSLLGLLLAVAVLLLDRPGHLPGLGAFALPLLAVILAWAFCAAVWTWYPFGIRAVWDGIHVAGSYLTVLFAVLAGGGGAMFLLARHRLRSKRHVGEGQRLASLESIERWMVRWSALTALLMTFIVATGVLEALDGESRLGREWWVAPKSVLAVVAWAGYVVVAMAPGFGRLRGGPAACLSIVCLLPLLVALSLATLVPEQGRRGGTGGVSTSVQRADCGHWWTSHPWHPNALSHSPLPSGEGPGVRVDSDGSWVSAITPVLSRPRKIERGPGQTNGMMEVAPCT